MPSFPLEWTVYRDPINNNIPMTGPVPRTDAMIDQERYYQPLEQIHASSVHTWGIANGLRVRAKRGLPEIQIETGVAIDADGHHVSLAANGSAELSPNPDPLNPVPTSVTANGVVLKAPVSGTPAEVLLTIQYWAAFDVNSPTAGTRRFLQMPWIRLQNPGVFNDDGTDGILLARVNIDAAGNVQRLREDSRRQVGLPVGRIRIRRAASSDVGGEPTTQDLFVDNADSGTIQPLVTGPHPGGSGIDVVLPHQNSEMHLHEQKGTFAKLVLAARRIVGRRTDGLETILVAPESAQVVVGAPKAPGSILVKDNADRDAVAIAGAGAELRVGIAGNEGDLRVLNGAGAEGMRVDGATGHIWYAGELRDPGGAHNGITHSELAMLTDGSVTSLHRHAIANAARPASAVWMSARLGAPATLTANFGTPTQVLAFVVLTSIDPRAFVVSFGDAFLAEVTRVDGADYRFPTPFQFPGSWFDTGGNLGSSGADANLRSPVFSGTATSLAIRVRSPGDTRIWALALIFAEP
jgi:hypothetical protein